MSITGPPPKENKIRRNADTMQPFSLSSDGSMVGPELPTGKDWCGTTREWWDSWRRSPQARAFEDTDWTELAITAVLHNAFVNSARPSSVMAAEIRQRVSKFGATIEDRQKLRMRIEHGHEYAPDDISSISGTNWRDKAGS